jgi:AAA family ATP:ADP antiporter
MQQAAIVDAHFVDRALRTAFFARIDVAVNALTLLAQIFLTGRIIKLLGVGLTLAILPIFCMAGFTALGVWQTLGVFVVFQTLRRATNYAVARPARETLYTVVPREDRYKAKNFMDTTVYRAADAIGGWSQSALRALGLTMSAIAFTAVPVALLWLGVALWLGRAQTQRLG